LPTSGSGCSKIVGQQKLPGGLLGGHGFLKLALSEEHSQKLAIQRGFNGASAAETVVPERTRICMVKRGVGGVCCSTP
jgi:surface antigen